MNKKYIVVGTILFASILRASESELYELVLDATEDQMLKSTARTQKHRATGKVLADKIRAQATEVFKKIETAKKAEKEQVAKQEKEVIELKKTVAEKSGVSSAQVAELTKQISEITATRDNVQTQLNELQEKYKKLEVSHKAHKQIIAAMAKSADDLANFAKNFGK